MAKKQARKKSVAKSKTPAKAGRRPRRSGAAKTGREGGEVRYLFGRKTDGNGSMKALLGGKGANLGEMCRIGLPVPPGFTVTTEVCTYYYANKRTYPPQLGADGGRHRRPRAADRQEVRRSKNPLLVSVRSGARDSMPGMMDTILNLGLNDQTVEDGVHHAGHGVAGAETISLI